MSEDRGLLQAILGDGRFLILLTGISLALSGGFAILQSVSGQLLPQDSHAIGMDSAALMQAGNRHLVGFMFHDRVAYGGSLLAIGAGYLWLAAPEFVSIRTFARRQLCRFFISGAEPGSC